MSKRDWSKEKISRRAAEAASKVLRNKSRSKSSMTAAGIALTQRTSKQALTQKKRIS